MNATGFNQSRNYFEQLQTSETQGNGATLESGDKEKRPGMVDSEAFVKMVRDTGFEPLNPTLVVCECSCMFNFIHISMCYENFERAQILLYKHERC